MSPLFHFFCSFIRFPSPCLRIPVHPGPFGQRYFYKWWKTACQNLGIENVDLYGGTRHTSAIALRKHHSPEEIKRGTMHSTNKAFERYLQTQSDDALDVYKVADQVSQAGKHLGHRSANKKDGKLLKLNK